MYQYYFLHAGQENQTPLSLSGITLLSTVIPGVLHMLLASGN